MKNLFSTQQLMRHKESIPLDKLAFARFTIVLSGIFSFSSAGILIVTTTLSDWTGMILVAVLVGLLILREFLKRRYTKHLLENGIDHPALTPLDILKLRDRFGVSFVEQVAMWVFTYTFLNFWPIVFVTWISVFRLVYRYRKLKFKTTG